MCRSGGLRVAARQPAVRFLIFAQELGLTRARIAADLPAVVRGTRGAVITSFEVFAQARLYGCALPLRAAIVDELVFLPQREHAGVGRRAGHHGGIEGVA